MTARPDPMLRPAVKLTSQLTRGDHIPSTGSAASPSPTPSHSAPRR